MLKVKILDLIESQIIESLLEQKQSQRTSTGYSKSAKANYALERRALFNELDNN